MEIKKQKGFTIIEIIVVIGILGIIAAVGTNMFFTVISGSTKSKNLTTVKQNGEYALSVMERMIRNSSDVITNTDGQICESGMTKIKIINSDKEEIEFAFIDLGGNSYIASNSSRITSDQVKVTSGVFNCSSTGDFNPKTIVIDFTLDQNISPTPRIEEEATMDFRMTVGIRNY